MLPTVQLQNRGLFTFSNQLSEVPPGAMTIAENIVIDRPGIAETRRGFDFYGTSLATLGANYALKGFIYMSELVWYTSNGSLMYDSDGLGTWVAYSGTYYPPTGNFVNSTQANGNFYFTTNNGIYKIAGLTGTPQQAGSPPALDVLAALAGVGSAMVTNSQVAYSVVWGYTDANNNLILGAPSSWAFLANAAGTTQNVTLTVTIPSTITTSHFLQIYRTPATASSAIVPGNNFQLAIVRIPTAGEITARTLTITDSIPDSLLGAYLYTADSQPSPFPNTPPPLAQDITTFNGMTFYVNWQTIQQANVTMDAVGAPSGIQIGDTFTLTDTTSAAAYVYTGAVGNSAALRTFAIVTGGTIAQNIDATARNLTAMINQDPNNTLWYAYYQTGTSILPGSIIITARNLQQGTFYANSSRTTCWTPVLPTAAATYLSGNLQQTGHFIVSKISQPEAVPLIFDVPVQTGDISVVLYRALALQDAVYLFSNAGIFRVTGTDPTNLQVVLFDSSALIIGLQTPRILNNSIYFNSSQGICSVAAGGTQIQSRAIEKDIEALAVLPNFTSLAYGVTYESDRKYFLFSPVIGSDTIAQQSHVYNWITQAWTLWTRACSAAIVNPSNNKMYVTDENGNVFEERKSLTNLDYSDQLYTVTISSTSTTNNTLTLVSSADVEIGDVIQQTTLGNQYSTQVTGNDLVGGVVDVDDATGFVAGSAQSYRSIATDIQYAPITCGFAQYNKKFSWWGFMFENANFETIDVFWSSDYANVPELQQLSPQASGGWGVIAWGTFPWGVATIAEQVIPAYPTTNTAYAHWVIIELQLTQAFTSLSLSGLSGIFDVVGTRGR
jgi:hypothetical protein